MDILFQLWEMKNKEEEGTHPSTHYSNLADINSEKLKQIYMCICIHIYRYTYIFFQILVSSVFIYLFLFFYKYP